MEHCSELVAEARKFKAELVGRLFAAEAAAVAFRAQLADDATSLARHVPTTGNVVGVGYGAKAADGQLTADLALRVYVRAKLARRHLSPQELIPDEINGVRSACCSPVAGTRRSSIRSTPSWPASRPRSSSSGAVDWSMRGT